MAEYKLSYTASEIDEKLSKVDKLVASVNGVKPDTNGNVNIDIPSGGSAIIDVAELPTENIREDVFYKVFKAQFVSNYYAVSGWICHYVDKLPDVGEPVSTDMINITGYYNEQDGEVYGYADNMISAAGGIPVGWYPIAILGQAFDTAWGGVITDVRDISEDSAYVLLSYDFYIYENGWCKIPFAYEKMPEFDIQWDGSIGDRFALDLTSLGFPNTYYVKISDDVFTIDKLIGATVTQSEGYNTVISESNIDTATYSGALDIASSVVIVYSSDDLNSALGLPAGYVTNGTYFVYFNNGSIENYTNRLVAPSKITKIDSKYLDLGDINIDLSNYVTKSNLTSYAKTSDVQTLIANAIGNAIGGDY